MRPNETSRKRRQSGAEPTSSPWQRRHGHAGFSSAIRLALLRASRTRWLLVIVALGIIVADVLICTVPLYNTLVSDRQLQNAMAHSNLAQRNMQISVGVDQINRSVSQQIAHQVQDHAGRYLGRFSAPDPMAYFSSDSLYAFVVNPNVKERRMDPISGTIVAHMQAFDYTILRPYLHLIQGSYPQTPAGSAASKRLQVMVTRELANLEHLTVGQSLLLTTDNSLQLPATISGIFEPVNENDPFWNGLSFRAPPPPSENLDPVFPILTTTETFFSAVGRFQLGMAQTWVYRTDLSKITAANMADVANQVIAFRSRIFGDLGSKYAVRMFGGLDQIIAGVRQQLGLIALPLYVIAAQIVGLALLFVAAMAALFIEQQSEEIATLKSRGTSGLQMLGIFTSQSTALGLLAALVGPFLALALALLVIHWFLPSPTGSGSLPDVGVLNSSDLSRIATPSLVALPALVGAVLGIAAVTVYALQAARLDVLALRRESARPSRQPFWRRAYLDLGLALLCLVGYLELDRFGGAQIRLALGNGGNSANSPILLLTPALLLLAGGLMLLRLIPLVTRAGARFASRGRGLTALLTFTQIERAPTRYARVTLLLILAVGLGLFALTFDATLAQNTQDRTAYAAGADVRLTTDHQVGISEAPSYLAHLKTLPGVIDATSLYRTNGRTPIELGNRPVDVLGVDSTGFAGIANPRSWRADYAAQSLSDLMSQLAAHHVSDSNAPGTTAHPLSAIISETLAQQLRLHVGDRFHLSISGILLSPPSFVVSAIVHEFPTLYPGSDSGGFLVVDLHDLENTIASLSRTSGGRSTTTGPNEFWLRTTSSAVEQQALLQALNHQQSDVILTSIESYQLDLQHTQDNPVTGGMRGLLLLGAITAALLAVLGILVQALTSARQRTTQFAIFRTLGMANRQLGSLLLGEQAVVYLFGLLGGTLLGLILTTATTPFLAYSDTAAKPSAIGIPPLTQQVNWPAIGVFYGVLLLAFVLALVIAARYAASIGLGRALRLGKD